METDPEGSRSLHHLKWGDIVRNAIERHAFDRISWIKRLILDWHVTCNHPEREDERRPIPARKGLPMRTRVSLTLALILTAVTVSTYAQNHGAGIFTEPEFEMRSDNGTVTIPFELVNNHLIIQVSLGGEAFDVILDTGMPISALMLYATDRVDELDLNYGSMQVGVAGAGGGDPISARLAQGETVDVGAIRMKNTTLLVMPPIPGISLYHQGIIGASLFENFVVGIDYDERKLHLHDPATYTSAKGAIEVPLAFHGSRRVPYVELKVKAASGQSTELQVVVDLGASHTLSLNMDTIEQFGIPASNISRTIGHGVSGPVLGRVGRIAGLELGGFAFDNVVTTFPISEHQHPGGMDSKNGNLGSGILKRFNVTFDYANKRMLLEPNKSFEMPFEWDMSGMRLKPVDTGLRIDEVAAGSPAADAGLAVDDVLTHVDGEPVSNRNMFELREKMKRDGIEMNIKATREGRAVDVKMTLRRMV